MTNETEAPDLLPCPFCGGEPKALNQYDSNSISCRCGPIMFRETHLMSEVAAVWNTRSDLSDAQAARIAELEVERDKFENGWLEAEGKLSDAEAKLAKVVETASGPAAWLDRWAAHVGDCAGGMVCTCGLSLARHEARVTLAELKDQPNDQ